MTEPSLSLSLSLTTHFFQAHVFCEAVGDSSARQLQAQPRPRHATRKSGQGAGEVLQGVLRLCKLRRAGVWQAHARPKDAHQRNFTQSLQM